MDKKQARTAALKRQVVRLEARSAALRQMSERYASLRLAVALAGIVSSVMVLFGVGQATFWASAILFGAGFGAAVYAHSRINAAITRCDVWRQIKLTHLARMALDWPNIPESPVTPLPGHPFEVDLDVTGPRSLHQLLDTTISAGGSARLREWLLVTVPNATQIHERQALVRELERLVVFRDKLTLSYRLASRYTAQRWDAGRLVDWLARHISSAGTGETLRRGLFTLIWLAALNISGAILNSVSVIPALWLISLLAYGVIFLNTARSSGALFEEALALNDILTRLRAVLHHLETAPTGGRLGAHLAAFRSPNARPTAYLRRIGRVLAAVSLQRNPFLWFGVNVIVPWDIFFAYRLHRCKTDLAQRLPEWLEALYDLEALNALATFAYLNPGTVYPVVSTDAFAFEGRALGHPLIPDAVRVCNDFHFDAPGQIVLITGSNMAGKSSFLRTLGLNLCLAYAGGPALAAQMRTTLFRLYTCIRVSDSVTDGFSYFYAEVRRLKALLLELERAHPYPLFFLIDEIFRGTNNRERLIGSRAYIRALAGQHGVGAISTHDLELVNLANEMPQVLNKHFREEVIEGRMVFDYRLRPGPCPTTNALKIMQMEGLPVGATETP